MNSISIDANVDKYADKIQELLDRVVDPTVHQEAIDFIHKYYKEKQNSNMHHYLQLKYIIYSQTQAYCEEKGAYR